MYLKVLLMNVPSVPFAKRSDRAHINVLDGMRGWALGLVVIYHILPIGQSVTAWGHRISVLPFTAIAGNAVDIFFFISGFVLFHPYARETVDGISVPPIPSFFKRRFFKIVPSYALVIVLLTASGYPHFTSLEDAYAQVVTHATFTFGLFPSTFEGIDGVLWSLAIEIELYCIFPLLVRVFQRAPRAATLVLVSIALAYRIVAALTFGTSNFVTYQMPGVFDLFAAGMLTAYAYRRAVVTPRTTRVSETNLAAWAVGAALAWCGILIVVALAAKPTNVWTLAASMTARTGEALALATFTFAMLMSSGTIQRVLANRVAIYLAAISYNLYLWHKVVGDTVRATMTLSSVQFTLVAIACSIVVASVLTFGFERPIIAYGRRISPRDRYREVRLQDGRGSRSGVPGMLG
ncbi:MAG: acyltransferase [Vulcanimicrobiaceae bacterium]